MSNSPKSTSLAIASLPTDVPSTPTTASQSNISPTSIPQLSLQATIEELCKPMRWIGNAKRMLEECQWSENSTSGLMALKWKTNIPEQLGDVNEDACKMDEDVTVHWFGQVSMNGSALEPDGGWKVCFGPLPNLTS
jgi:hypothetical protein